MTITIASDTGKRYAGYAIAFDKQLVYAGLVKVQAAPNLHGPEYRQGKHKQPECELANTIARTIANNVLTHVTTMTDVEFIAELPTSKDHRAKKIRSEDLMFLALTAGAISAAIPFLGHGRRTRFVEPSEWKGQAPDSAVWRRIDGALTTQERTQVGETALRARYGADFHHVLESVGIALWSLWRI
jgi:hypothetical protein